MSSTPRPRSLKGKVTGAAPAGPVSRTVTPCGSPSRWLFGRHQRLGLRADAAEALALPHPVEQPERDAHAGAREVDRQRRAWGRARLGKVAGAQYCRRRRLRGRGRRSSLRRPWLDEKRRGGPGRRGARPARRAAD